MSALGDLAWRIVRPPIRAAYDTGRRDERERVREAFRTYAGQPWACPHADEWQRAMADILDWLPANTEASRDR